MATWSAFGPTARRQKSESLPPYALCVPIGTNPIQTQGYVQDFELLCRPGRFLCSRVVFVQSLPPGSGIALHKKGPLHKKSPDSCRLARDTQRGSDVLLNPTTGAIHSLWRQL